jgi:hypothetical protein
MWLNKIVAIISYKVTRSYEGGYGEPEIER